jgi:hypothetical protein
LGKEIDLLVDCLRAAPTWLQHFNILDQTFLKALRPVTVQPELGWAWIPTCPGRAAEDVARVFRFERAVRLINESPDEGCIPEVELAGSVVQIHP